MAKQIELFNTGVRNQAEAVELMEKLLDVADSKTVFSKPIELGEYKVITASAVSTSMGFGYGSGGAIEAGGESSEKSDQPGSGFGGGGGGGGLSTARPVAVIEIGPQGVRIEPIMDPTKIAVTFFTTLIWLSRLAWFRRGRK